MGIALIKGANNVSLGGIAMNDRIEKGQILVVDDNQPHLDLLRLMLTEHGYRVHAEVSGDAAIRLALLDPPDLILLDIAMPDINGLRVCKVLKDNPLTANVPVIFISALDSTEEKIRAFEMGGVDYVTKPYQADEVLARVEAHLALYFQHQEIERLRERDRLYAEKLRQFVDDAMNKASHDLRDPLASIKTAAFLLDRYDTLDEVQRRKMLSTIRRSVDLMASLIADLLDLAKIEIPEEQEAPPAN